MLQMAQLSSRDGLEGKQFLWLPQQIVYNKNTDSAQSLSWNSACSLIWDFNLGISNGRFVCGWNEEGPW